MKNETMTVGKTTTEGVGVTETQNGYTENEELETSHNEDGWYDYAERAGLLEVAK